MKCLIPLLALQLFAVQDNPVRFARDVQSADQLGLTLNDLTVEDADRKGLAFKSGLRPGDLIVRLNKTDVSSWEDVLAVMSAHPLDIQFALVVERKGKKKKLKLKLSRMKSAMSLGRGGKAGQHSRSIDVGGKSRTYLLKAPPAASKGAPMPLVVLLHGDAGTGAGMIDWTPAAHRDAILLALDGLNQSWRDDSDVEFVLQAIRHESKLFNIDLRRIYALGFSSGAMLAYKLGYMRGDIFAAVGVYAGGASSGTASKRKSTFVFFHGTGDATVGIDKARDAVQKLKTDGYTAELLEERGLGHDYTMEASKKLWLRLRSIVFK